jgi:hypothetical protein
MRTDELWHIVEARRVDGKSAMFRIRDLEPVATQERIFVVELPYPPTQISRLPDAASYRRLSTFEEQWLRPACTALGWTFVAVKTEDGSTFFYLYGSGDTQLVVEKLSPFDGSLAFFDERDAAWDEYGALRDLLVEANALKTTKASPSQTKKKSTKKKSTKKKSTKKKSTKKLAPTKPTAKKSKPSKKK